MHVFFMLFSSSTLIGCWILPGGYDVSRFFPSLPQECRMHDAYHPALLLAPPQEKAFSTSHFVVSRNEKIDMMIRLFTLPETNSKSTWKWMIGIPIISFWGKRPIFKGERLSHHLQADYIYVKILFIYLVFLGLTLKSIPLWMQPVLSIHNSTARMWLWVRICSWMQLAYCNAWKLHIVYPV